MRRQRAPSLQSMQTVPQAMHIRNGGQGKAGNELSGYRPVSLAHSPLLLSPADRLTIRRLQGLEEQMGWISSSLATFLQSQTAATAPTPSAASGQFLPAVHPGDRQSRAGQSGNGHWSGSGSNGTPGSFGQAPNSGTLTAFAPPPMPPSMLGPNASPGFPLPPPGVNMDHRGVRPLPFNRYCRCVKADDQSFPYSSPPNGPSPRSTHPLPMPLPSHAYQPQLSHLNQNRTSGIRTPDPVLKVEHEHEDANGDEDETESIPDIPLRSLASRMDVARLVADGHIVQEEEDDDKHYHPPGASGRRERRASELEDPKSDSARRKRARFDDSRLDAREYGSSSLREGMQADSPEKHANKASVPRPKGDLARTFGDPVDLGICTDDEGRKLVEL